MMFFSFTVYVIENDRMMWKWWTGKVVKGSCCDLSCA